MGHLILDIVAENKAGRERAISFAFFATYDSPSYTHA